MLYVLSKILALLNLLLFFVLMTSCCDQIELGSGLIELRCTNITMFPGINRRVHSLYCSDCHIDVLEDKTMFKRFEGTIFNISNAHLQVINMDAFKSFGTSTRRFIFENNQITYISPKVFNKFTIIKEINFRNCKILKPTDRVFEGTTVDVLDLSQNVLNNVTGIFDGLYVNKLNLSLNKIDVIDMGAFDNVIFNQKESNAYLDLSNNIIEALQPGVFKCDSPNNCFQVLDLQNNAISAIENGTFENLNYLETLVLDHNKISKLNANSFKGLNNLHFLRLQNNRIREIPTGIFANVRRLTLLDLSQNFLTSLNGQTFSGLLTLQILNLSHNNLQVLKNGYLLPLIHLIDLDITDIRIHELKIKGLLEVHYRLKSLVLNNNFWTCQQLMQIYKQMNKQFGGFSSPTSYYNVPNLHGVACSRRQLSSYDNITFDDFLDIVVQDKFMGYADWRMMDESDVSTLQSVNSDNRETIESIRTMFVVFIVIVFISFVYFIFKEVLLWLNNYDIIKSNRLSFLYTQSGSTVKVL